MIAALALVLVAPATSPATSGPAPIEALAPAPVAAFSRAEIDHAIAVGRFDEAQLMIDRAASAGAVAATMPLRADLAFARGHDAEAWRRYELLLRASPGDARLLERAGIAALRAGQSARGIELIDRAVRLPGASWRAWNAKASVADARSDWAVADEAYSRAATLAPNSAEVANNRGWSLLLRGDWEAAEADLARAATLAPNSATIRHNLEFVRLGLAGDLPARRDGESSSGWAERLTDAGIAARMRGDRALAIRAFSRAIEVSEVWASRAAANLAELTPTAAAR